MILYQEDNKENVINAIKELEIFEGIKYVGPFFLKEDESTYIDEDIEYTEDEKVYCNVINHSLVKVVFLIHLKRRVINLRNID